MEAISCLVDFAKRGMSPPSSQGEDAIRPFATSTPKTPTAAPRPDRPPVITSRRVLPLDTPRPRPLRRPAALGAPPVKEEEEELPDIPDTPESPTVSDITGLRLVLFKICFLNCF